MLKFQAPTNSNETVLHTIEFDIGDFITLDGVQYVVDKICKEGLEVEIRFRKF